MKHETPIKPRAKVVGSDGLPVGTVDRLEGDRIKLARNGPQADGFHRFLQLASVASVEGNSIRLSMTAAEAMASWQHA